MSEEPGTSVLLDSVLPYTKAEIIWICRNEMPVTLEDILARRTRSLFLDVRTSLKIAPQVASIMSRELSHDKKWEEEQINAFTLLSKNYL
jgi:glycerol-3-phosphate dehydrogenase